MARVAVVIPNWNGAHLLPTCLGALRRQTFRDFVTVVVDNGSTDDSRRLLAEQYPEAHVVPLPVNRGLAVATNVGIALTDSEIVATLNNDTEADPDWLGELVGGLDAHPEAGSAASKLLLFDRRDVLHSAGDYYRLDGTPGNLGVWERDSERYSSPELVFGACAGAAAYRRRMLDDVGLFDESLFMYCEDVDLAFRAQLLGYRCIFVPTAIVYHMLSASGGGPLASYYCGRNFLRVVAKDMPAPLLRRYILAISRAQLRIALQAVRHIREPAARARLRGQIAGLLDVPAAIRARRQLQPRRRVSTAYLTSIMVRP